MDWFIGYFVIHINSPISENCLEELLENIAPLEETMDIIVARHDDNVEFFLGLRPEEGQFTARLRKCIDEWRVEHFEFNRP
jgi:hypothetical protein